MSDEARQGSGKQFARDVSDVDPDDNDRDALPESGQKPGQKPGLTRRGSGKQFGEGPGEVEQADDDTVPAGSGKQFAEDVADVVEEPETGDGSEKGFARGQRTDGG